jgi:hypothetical protein
MRSIHQTHHNNNNKTDVRVISLKRAYFFLRAEAARRRSLWKHWGIDPSPNRDRSSIVDRRPFRSFSFCLLAASRFETTSVCVNYAALCDLWR